MKRAFTPLALAVLLLTGCDSPQKTADTLRREIAGFKATSDETKQLPIEQSFVKLENQIRELEKRNAPQADGLKEQLVALRSDYQAAKVNKAFTDAKKALQGISEAVKDSAKSIGDIFKDSGTKSD
ncbi:MAG: hypothetical protein WCQ57_15505 [Verrucomicrobiota bacterium]